MNHCNGKGNPLNAGRWNSKIIDPAWPGPKIQLMDPKRWDFEVFYRVISLSILVSRYGRLSKLLLWVWNVLGHELSNRQLQTFGNLLSELHFRFDGRFAARFEIKDTKINEMSRQKMEVATVPSWLMIRTCSNWESVYPMDPIIMLENDP